MNIIKRIDNIICLINKHINDTSLHNHNSEVPVQTVDNKFPITTLPTTLEVGAILPNTIIANRTVVSVLTEILVKYLLPIFTSQNVTGQNSIVEVGTTLSGNRTFTWSTLNSGNVKPNTVAIFDNNTATNISSGLANDGSETVTLNSLLLNANNATQSWKIKAQNTKDENFESGNITVTALHPIFFYVSNTPPVANQVLIDSGLKQVVQSDGNINITFGAVGQYLWFAHPAVNTTKTKWYVNALNNGNIGTISDLFNAPTTVNITTALWNGIPYKIYISNNPTTTTGNMEIKNS